MFDIVFLSSAIKILLYIIGIIFLTGVAICFLYIVAYILVSLIKDFIKK